MRIRPIAAAFAALALAACAQEPGTAPGGAEPGEPAWKPDPVPEAKEILVAVEAAQPKVAVGEDLVFRVTVRNTSQVKARLTVPRLSRGSVSFKVRHAAFDVAWLDPTRVKESEQGPEREAEEVREVPPGGSVEGEIRQTAVLAGAFTFVPLYQCQSLGTGPIAAPAIQVEVTPSAAGPNLGVRLETSQGTIDVKLRGDLAFQTVTSFATLVKSGFYDGLRFHRVVRGFMAQGGDPRGKGWGGPGYMIRRELHGKLPHRRGVLSMARMQHPDTAGSQFFLMFRDDSNLDKLGYATFGEMTSGADALQRIESLASEAPDGGDQSPREPVILKKASLIFLP